MTAQPMKPMKAVEGPPEVPAATHPIGAMMAIYGRNLEALLEAQQIMMEGNKALLERQFQCLRSTLDETMKASQVILDEPNVKANFKKRCEAMKASMHGGTCNSNILTSISADFQVKASQVIQDRIYAAIDESQAVIETLLDGCSSKKNSAA